MLRETGDEAETSEVCCPQHELRFCKRRRNRRKANGPCAPVEQKCSANAVSVYATERRKAEFLCPLPDFLSGHPELPFEETSLPSSD